MKQSHVPAYFTQDWFANAAPALREAVQRSQSRLLRSQATLARSLRGLEQVAEFAESRLKACLAERGCTAPLRGTELLRVESTWHWIGLRTLYSHRRDNLLQAALQNFADDESFTPQSAIALSANIHVTAAEVQGIAFTGAQTPASHFAMPTEHYLVDPLPLAPASFAALCRTLDLGGNTRLIWISISPSPRYVSRQ
ncbi:hypothetical protein OGV25_11600 [Pseudomonas sp. P1B16]|uniref:dermonecrotic toxin domain-containing protein n=1 Tax=Pseudomonas sp. P1B16 TaxID=2986074 RepID=UPI002A24BEC6|nr:DUF6543 domain-containing protein [Pseudomonas sp. P1B16]WPM28688.1 hypothetical protein OGV25_11600 [Pseudomonas sp. P1B16]